MGSRRPGPTALISIPEEDRRVDPHLGYPRAYAKLCRNGYAWLQLQGYSLPHSDGPPKTFLPYAARPEDLAKLEQLQDLFPIIINDTRKEHMALHKFKDVLWQQLDHLGNAGFDPACFRVDAYGNVLYWHADPSSPLAWEVSHWFPYSRGGKTMLNNLRLVHWQVSLKKREKLEFLIPWWDLQLGVSVNQFLSAFESPNIGFRQRCLSYLFLGGEDEMPDGRTCLGNHQWSHPFLEKQKKLGLAVAGLVRMQRSEDVLKSSAANSRLYASSPGHHHKGWSIAEEEALLRGYQKFGFGNWKAIKESDAVLANRSLVQIRDKYRSLTGLEKENIITPNSLSPVHHQIKSPSSIQDMPESVGQVQIERLLSSLKRESKIKLLRDEEKHMREGESSKLQQTLQAIKEQNEKEKTALDTLEAELRKQRRQLEKQRQWNETQTSYRICLERMIQETMHQSVVYKEESRLNEIACNSLMAQLESQAATCSAAESRLLQHASKKQDLLQMTRPLPLLESGNTHESESINTPSKNSITDTTKKQKHVNLPPRGERSVLQPRDIQNHMAIHKHDILSDSEEQHRNNKRLKKSSTTPAKRCQSAPRQRMEKENCGVGHEYSTTPRFTSKKLDAEMDKLYYEGNKCSKIRAGESRRTLGHAMNSKGYVVKPVENERMEKIKEHSGINNDEVKSTSPSVEAEETTARTFKLMPVIKNGQNKNIESGYSSCGSQRFKGILHAPQSRDSSEKFELDFSVLDSHAKENELPNEHRVNSNVDSKSPEVSGHGTNSEVERKSPDMSDHGTVIESPGLNEESIKEGKSTLDKWLQMLLLSTEPTIENEQEAQAVVKSDEECNRKLNGIGRTWPEDVAVLPPGLPHGLTRGYSVRGPEERPKKATSDKIKVPFSGFLKRLSLRQQYSNSKTAVNEADVKDPPRRQVTFEDWEGITNKLAAMNLNTGNASKLRSTSLRASTGSLSQLKNLSVAEKNIPSVISLDPSPNKVTRSVLYYSTEKKGEKQMANMKAMSRRASIDECAQAWKMGVNKLEAQQNN